MKKIISALNIIIAVYFFGLANFLFWVSALGLFTGVLIKSELLKDSWTFVVNMLLAPFLIYGTIIFFRKTKNKYSYGLILLFLIWAETQIHRFFFITENKLEMTDLLNLAFFGVPFMIIYLTKYLNTKYVSGH